MEPLLLVPSWSGVFLGTVVNSFRLVNKPGKYDTANWTVEIQGDLTQVKATGPRLFVNKTKKRKCINAFSAASRLRVLKLIARVDWNQFLPGVFITLTYPDNMVGLTYKERSKHRYLFHRAMERYLGTKVASLWRIEWVPRRSGTWKGFLIPHLHLLVSKVSYIPWRVVREWWRSAIGASGYLHTWIEKIEEAGHAAKYCCKYVAKQHSFISAAYHNTRVTVGRMWGVLRARQIARCPVRLYRPLSPSEIDFVKGLRKYVPDVKPFWREVGFTIFGADVADQVYEILSRPLAAGEVLE